MIRHENYCQSLEFAAFSALATVLFAYSLVEVSKLYGVCQPTSKVNDDQPVSLDADLIKLMFYEHEL